MNYIDLKIYYEFFNDELTESYKELKYEAIYKSSTFEKEAERDLFVEIMTAKNDGMTFDVHSIGSYHTIVVNLFYSMGLEADLKLVEMIRNWCEKMFEVLDRVDDKLAFDNFRTTSDGVLLNFDDIYDTEFLADLSEVFAENSLEVQIIGHKKHSYERGAGDYREELILFIKSSIESGVAWDVIKGIFTLILVKTGMNQNQLVMSKSFDSDQIISAVSEKINENAMNIRITDIRNNSETGYTDIELKTQYSLVHLTCDDNNNFTRFHVEELTQTRI
ncbi:hypothetical protein [Paenibacillus sp. FSL H7-0714]|uniref:hypothetical protein n=1 Tax=Paenibacillus sp. FSL H7-0714 TaxID=2954735 RepID=UPI0030F81DD9